jgi:hypothetical protein
MKPMTPGARAGASDREALALVGHGKHTRKMGVRDPPGSIGARRNLSPVARHSLAIRSLLALHEVHLARKIAEGAFRGALHPTPRYAS